MASALAQRVWDHLESEFGEDLRGVTRYEGMEFSTHLRDDIRAQYSSKEDRDIVDSTIIPQLQLNDSRDTIKAGDAEATIRVFEQAWVLMCPDPDGPKSGFIVSIERNGEHSMTAIQDTLEYLTTEISPHRS